MSNQVTRILVVEDEVDALETVADWLEFNGYEVLVARDGREGLDKALSEEPDLVLLDVMMPKLNGYQVCREIRKNTRTQHIPVIMLTAKAQESDRFWGMETGASDYITKPFDMDVLGQAIESNLKQKAA